jgi:hypothetical protein
MRRLEWVIRIESKGERMIAKKIPAVLFQENKNSLSLERVLKIAIELINELPTSASDAKEDKVIICLEDLEIILKNLDRS